jgi:hypothetical protein
MTHNWKEHDRRQLWHRGVKRWTSNLKCTRCGIVITSERNKDVVISCDDAIARQMAERLLKNDGT